MIFAVKRKGIVIMEHRRRKKSVKKSTVIKIVAGVVIASGILTGVVIHLKNRVKNEFAKTSAASIKTAKVESGSVSTTVYGTGRLEDDDVETQEIPEGVKLTELKVEVGDTVTKGAVIAEADLSTVLAAMSDTQASIDAIDKKVKDASDDKVTEKITTAVAGRVKKIYAKANSDVSSVMVNNKALLLLSMDGYMAVDIESDTLEAGNKVKVTTSNKKTYDGTVRAKSGKKVTIILTDNGPAFGDKVTVKSKDGKTELGTGELYIHDQLAIVGYAGTIKSVSVKVNQKISAGAEVFKLKDTSYTANYEQYLNERKDLEEKLLSLTEIYRAGALTADYDGTIRQVPDIDDKETTSSSTATSADSTETASTVFKICPDKTMTVAVSIDETDILSVSVGQKAEVTISSVSEDKYAGEITKIDRNGTSTNGVTTYTASIKIDKAKGMLAGMSASANIDITSVENTLIIPIDALKKTSSTAYVYTSYASEKDELGGMTKVEAGISNSNYVEIKSGLKEGDTVYYKEKTTNTFNMPGRYGNNNFPGNNNSNSNRRSTGSNNRSGNNNIPNGNQRSSGNRGSNNG